jgi:uncharacterized Tic20 family protein
MENFETDSSVAKPVLPRPHERVIAVLAHLSVFVPFFGWLIAFTFWLANRGESRYAAFQAKQACIFQFLMGFVGAVSCISSAILSYNAGYSGYSPFGYGLLGTIVRGYGFFIPLFMLLTFTISYSLVGAIYCAWGLPFRYRFISLWLRPE